MKPINTLKLLSLLSIVCLADVVLASRTPSAASIELGPSTFTAPGSFPTSLFERYYNNPTVTSEQPQPVITDPISHSVYPFSLTDPNNIPQNNTKDPIILPPPATPSQILEQAINLFTSIRNNPVFQNDPCAACQASLAGAKFVALAAPQEGPAFAIQFCEAFAPNTGCETMFSPETLGSVFTQVVASADVGGFDGRMICQNFLGACTLPPTQLLNLTGWFAKPKPNPLPPPKQSKGRRAKVLHTSDIHLDSRFANGAEANCTSGLCCRANNFNTSSPSIPLVPAPRFSSFLCDTNYALVGAILDTIPIVTNTDQENYLFSIFTGDLVAHDSNNEQSRDYTLYSETVVYDLLKRLSGSAPVYASLGNHDSSQSSQDAPHSLPGGEGTQFSWNYDHVSALWEEEGWITSTAAQQAKAHYAGYSVTRGDGLRILVLNTDMWYTDNWFNFINMTTIDPSGMLRFVTDELQDAEDAGDRVWILGHVLSGWTSGSALQDSTNLFYQIVDRFSPHVIKAIFFGHSHQDHGFIYYTNNATVQSADTAVTFGWVGPSVTPVTDYNVGFRMYEIDPDTFDILDAHTWFADVTSFPALDSQAEVGPTFMYEYNTRETYGGNIAGWGPNDPLNATWWHLVSEAMETDPTLVSLFHKYQSKSSALTTICDTPACIAAQICYLRSGSQSISLQNCNQQLSAINP